MAPVHDAFRCYGEFLVTGLWPRRADGCSPDVPADRYAVPELNREVPVATKELPPAVLDFWRAFEASVGGEHFSRFYEAFHFADSEAAANALAALVLRGTKRATASLVWSFEAAGQPLLAPGNLSLVTNWDGEPMCIIETMSVEVVPFQAVTAEFASVEGEGDGSLEYWRDEHWACFGRECLRIGKEPSLVMPVACEKFKVVYRGGGQAET